MGFWEDVAKVGLAPVTGGLSLVSPDAGGLKELGQDAFDPGHDERKEAREIGKRGIDAVQAAWEQMPTEADLYRKPEEYRPYGIADYSLEDNVHTRGPDDIYTIEDRSDMVQGGPVGKLAQGMGLGYYGNLAAGGPDAAAEAAYSRSVMEAEQRARAQRDAAMQQAEMRGTGGSGAELLADLTGGQAAATSANMAGMQRAADEQARRDMAAGKFTDLGTTMRDQGLTESEAQWNAFYKTGEHNTNAQNDAAASNMEAMNTAAWEDWNRWNQTGDKNTGMYNETVQWNQQIPQTIWDNQMMGAGMYANAANKQASVVSKQGGEPFAAGPMLMDVGSNTVKAAGGAPTNPYSR